MPPISSFRSRPPVPSACETPPPRLWMRQVTSCSPVPDAATRPMSPRRTTLAKPSGTPLTIAVPQSGPHHQQALRSRAYVLIARFVGDRHVVGEQHHVQAERQRLHRLGGGVVAGHRDQREVGVGRALDAQARCWSAAARTRRLRRSLPRPDGMQHRLGRGDALRRRPRRRRARPPADPTATPAVSIARSASLQLREVGGRGHQARGLRDAFALAQLGAELHQRHRILVQIREHLESGRRHDHAIVAATPVVPAPLTMFERTQQRHVVRSIADPIVSRPSAMLVAACFGVDLSGRSWGPAQTPATPTPFRRDTLIGGVTTTNS